MVPTINMLLGEVAPGGVGSGPLRHARARGAHGLRCGAARGPHPGVPGPQGWRCADQAGEPVHPRDAGARARWNRAELRRAGPESQRHRDVDPQSRATTASRNCSTRSPPPPTTTAPPSRASPRTPRGSTPRSAWRCCSVASCPSCWCSRSRARSRPRRRCPRARAPCPTHRPQFVGMLVAVTAIVTALTFFPILTLGPLAEGIH